MHTRWIHLLRGAALVCTVFAVSAYADSFNLVNNGSFEDIAFQGTATILNYPQYGGADAYTLNYNDNFSYQTGEATVLADWSIAASGYFAYVVEPPSSGAFDPEYDYDLWPGITASVPLTSPDGGNFLIEDATNYGGPSQTISGLVAGDTYTLSFYQAASQAYPYNGDTSQQWIVSLGSQTFYSDVMNNAQHDFTLWEQQTTTFVANASSELLSFLGNSGQIGGSEPPFLLLDGVSLVDTTAPEPGCAGLLSLGLAGLFGIRKLRGSNIAGGNRPRR